MEERSIGLEELGQQTFDPVPVDVGDWVEKLEIDVYELLGWKSKNMQTGSFAVFTLSPSFSSSCFLFDIVYRFKCRPVSTPHSSRLRPFGMLRTHQHGAGV